MGGRKKRGDLTIPLSYFNGGYYQHLYQKRNPRISSGIFVIHFLNKFYSFIKKMKLLKKETGIYISLPCEKGLGFLYAGINALFPPQLHLRSD